MAKLAGVDIAGWHDAACCSYDLASGEPATEPVIVDGGVGSVVVDMMAEGTTRVIAGPQAILSPIGRGGGWGSIGSLDRRRSLRAPWRDLLGGATVEPRVADLAAGIKALAASAERVLFCMPDRPEMSERSQQVLLRGLSGRDRGRPTLLWRSVAVLLDVLDGGQLPNAAPGKTVVVLTHETDGIAIQHFVLRPLEVQGGMLAPERAAVGQIIWPEWGLERLLELLTHEVNATNPALGELRAETPRLPLSLLLTEPPLVLPEIIRRDNGDWLQIDEPARQLVAPDIIAADPHISPVDLVLLASPLAARHRYRLETDVRRCWPGVPLLALDAVSAARGALYAAQRIARDVPHYLDRLDPIALAVMHGDTPVFEDLIPKDAAVPGNREYVSPPITSLVWAAGMSRAKFYIRKGERETRYWQTPEVAPPATPQPLIVHLRQTPAQGWATLTVTSPTWEPLRARPIVLDWNSDELQLDERSPDEILKSLERPAPVVPKRIRHEPHIGLWNGDLRKPGLLSTLRAMITEVPTELAPMIEALRSSFRVKEQAPDGKFMLRQVYPIGTDGDVPSDVDPEVVACLDRVLSVVADRLEAAVASSIAQTDNQLLLTATWAFGRCPAPVQWLLADAFFKDRAGQTSPLLNARQSRKALVHGLGRSVTDGALAVRLVRELLDGEPSTDALGAAAALLSRPAATPRHLQDGDMDFIVNLLIRLLRRIRQAQTFGVSLKYGLLCTAGLLRIRERVPGALVVRTSFKAQTLRDEIAKTADKVAKHFELGKPPIPGRAAKLAIMADLVALLDGTGGSPDILTNVDALEDA